MTHTSSHTSWTGLAWHVFRYQNVIFFRNLLSAFFALAFPLMFLLIFGGIFGSQIDPTTGVPVIQTMVPSMLVFAVVSSTYINLAIVVPIARDEGILKRVRGTPMPPSAFMVGRIASAVWVALISAAIQLVVAVFLYDFEIIWRTVPAAMVGVVLGIACFSALGLAVASIIPNGDSAPMIANFTALPILFLSGIFLPLDAAPAWVRAIGEVFPIRHMYLALAETTVPPEVSLGFAWTHLGVVALWTAAGVIAAVRFFRWDDNRD